MERTQQLTLYAVYAGSLALAAALGYNLAIAQGLQSLLVITVVLMLIAAPLLLRGHQAILLLCWNSTLGLHIFPGQLPAWIIMAVASLGLLLFQRMLNRQEDLTMVGPVTLPVLAFGLVVVVTILARGGLGIQMFSSTGMAGGRKYIYILGALVAYFAISMQRIPADKVRLYSALFFLGGLTGFIGPLGSYLGNGLQYLVLFFQPMEGVATYVDTFRVKGMSYVGNAIVGILLARYGFGGVFHTRQAWRPLLFGIGVVLGLISGFRTLLVLYVGTLAMMFFLEGWHRTKWLPIWACVALFGYGILHETTVMLPTPVQRALAVLPLPVESTVRLDATATIEWRQGLWDALLHDLPKYIWLGKGMAISARDMEWTETLSRFGGNSWDYSYITGEHHNGFLSVTTAFGVWGFIAFSWILLAGIWLLYKNWRHGRPDLIHINAFLLSWFVVWIFLFFSYWGTLYYSLRDFMGVLGFSVALNHGVASARSRATWEQE